MALVVSPWTYRLSSCRCPILESAFGFTRLSMSARIDSFVQLGSMYGTKPGFYLLIGPDWHGEVPKGITQVFRSSSSTGVVGPRVFQDDMPEDQRVVQAPLAGVMIYPLAEYDGKMKTIDWSNIPQLPPPPLAKKRRNGSFLRNSPTNCPSR
jgi:hypothetical protein